jgi:hypothetical protein
MRQSRRAVAGLAVASLILCLIGAVAVLVGLLRSTDHRADRGVVIEAPAPAADGAPEAPKPATGPAPTTQPRPSRVFLPLALTESPSPAVAPDQGPKFITALAADAQGRVWIASEGDGVWCYSPNLKSEISNPQSAWRQFTTCTF